MRGNLSKQSWKFGWGRNFVECPKLAGEAPHATQKVKEHIGPKRPLGLILGPGSLPAAWIFLLFIPYFTLRGPLQNLQLLYPY